MKFLDTIDPQALQDRLPLTVLEYHATIGSTQDRAHQWARECPGDAGRTQPLLVVAEQQTAGRGRGGNQWWTGAGSLAFSAVISPAAYGLGPSPIPSVSLVVALAIVQAAQKDLPDFLLGLHWPNDVFVSGRKLSGVLVDVLPDGRYVLGVGVNVNNSFVAAPDEVRQRGVSLADLAAKPFDRTQLLAALFAEMESALRQFAADPAEFGQQFNHLCLQRGADLVVETPRQRTTGRCAGIAPDGALLLESPHGLERIYSGVLR